MLISFLFNFWKSTLYEMAQWNWYQIPIKILMMMLLADTFWFFLNERIQFFKLTSLAVSFQFSNWFLISVVCIVHNRSWNQIKISENYKTYLKIAREKIKIRMRENDVVNNEKTQYRAAESQKRQPWIFVLSVFTSLLLSVRPRVCSYNILTLI